MTGALSPLSFLLIRQTVTETPKQTIPHIHCSLIFIYKFTQIFMA